MYFDMAFPTNRYNIQFMFSIISVVMMILFRLLRTTGTLFCGRFWHFSFFDCMPYSLSCLDFLRMPTFVVFIPFNSLPSITRRFSAFSVMPSVCFLSCLTLVIFLYYSLAIGTSRIFFYSFLRTLLATTLKSTFLGRVSIKVYQRLDLLANSACFHPCLQKTRPLAIARKCHPSRPRVMAENFYLIDFDQSAQRVTNAL